jgi:hypothetical protein
MEENKVEISVEDIRNCCNTITSKILSQMRGGIVPHLDKKSIAEGPVLYRWWFPEDFVDALIDKFKNLEKSDLERKEIKCDNKCYNYYALYFGKSKNGRKRFNQHTSKNIDKSTLRRTIHAIISTPSEKILCKCYFEWVEVDNENLLECLEAMCIVSGKYPLNIEGNPYSQDWIVNARKNKKYK